MPRAAPGEVVGRARYQILRRLGSGAMGVVYEAFDRERGVPVAVKMLRRLAGDRLLRFKTEFRALQDIAHPNLVTLGELFEDGGRWFFTMERVDGVPFLDYVRPGEAGAASARAVSGGDRAHRSVQPAPPGAAIARPNGAAWHERRLRGSLAQIVDGLGALHAAGKVHRDLKPSNVRITPEGRAVVLDFGLVADVSPGAPHGDRQVVGTAEYMAPEQAASRPVSPASDWYALGVMLYEALTGTPPLTGPPLSVLLRKQTEDPPPPRALAAGAPPDLDALCSALLARDPDARPGAADIARCLRTARPAAPRERRTMDVPFVGRDAERAELAAALERVAAGGTEAVVVVGETGVGKTALAKQFCIDAQRRGALVLFGRCFERETVPFKGIDGVIDAVFGHLRELDDDAASLVLPREVDVLAQTFPVLGQIEAVAKRLVAAESAATDRAIDPGAGAPSSAALRAAIDPVERRMRLFRAVRDLFARLSADRPVVVAIDDLHWADADSLRLLGEVLRPPRAPRVLVVATSRPPPPGADALPVRMRELRVTGLAPGDARELVDRILGGRRSPAIRDRIAAETAGHPLFIAELAHHFAHAAPDAPPAVDLDQAVAARVARLEPAARDVLIGVALAGAPLSQAVVEAAARIDAATCSRAVETLRAQRLVSTSGSRRGDTVEPYHDRIRQSVVHRLDADARAAWHRRLASALAAARAPRHDEVMHHSLRGGDLARAREHAILAAGDARRALAFEREAALWRIALDLSADAGASDRARMLVRLADALVHAGRAGDAADAFVEAASHCAGDEAADLERRAAEQLLRCGRMTEGYALLRRIVRREGLPFPDTPRRALWSLVGQRLRLRARGLSFRERSEADADPSLLRRADLCWSAAAGLSFVDSIRGAGYQARQLRLALAAGEPYRVARGLALEAGFVANTGGTSLGRARSLADRALALALRTGRPDAIATAEGAIATVLFHAGCWRESRNHVDSALARFRDECTGVEKELIAMQLLHLSCTAMLGEVDVLAERLPDALRHGRERGDRFATTSFATGLGNLAWLAAGDPAEARRQADDAIAPWPEEPFVIQHALDLLAQVNIDLYEGRADAAWRRVQQRWPALARSLLLRAAVLRGLLVHARARAALSSAARRGAGAADGLRAASRDARTVARVGAPWATGAAGLVRAGIAYVRGDLDAAVRQLTGAIADLDAADTLLFAHLARRRLGELVGGDAGRAEIARADAWLARHRVADAGGMARALVPGICA
ncbi:MAG: serine/threonine-protein kinase PknK [Deltaproteobacteria bacterium]|nr:MAG: serine/threonine-protein kinase PknK [Deltaproteobacteria bacterium]